MSWGLAAAAGASLVGGMMGANAAKDAAAAQMASLERAYSLFKGIKVPSIEEQKVILQNPDLMGLYTPEQVQAMEFMTSSMEGVSAEADTLAAQKQALEGISEVAEGGFTEADKSVAREINREISSQSQARQKAILNAMAQRGTLGSGMELAAQLQGEQQSIDQASRAGENLTQQAQARALAALGQQGGLASQMRGQEFGEKADIARAQDAIKQFNLQNRQRVQEMNVGEQNRAQMYNLQQRQMMENQRADLANQQQQYNKNLVQQRYQNLLQRASGMAGLQSSMGQVQAQAAQNRGQMYAGVASGLANLAAGYKTDADKQHELDLAKASSGKG